MSTTSENADLPFSTPTELLKPWQDIARLGQLIVKEFNLANSNRVMGRWMAYRVAELMHRAEATVDPAAKEVAERECQDLVLRLWDLREQWPTGGPLCRVIPTLHQLLDESPISIRFAGEPEGPRVGGLLTKLLRAQRQELRQVCELVSNSLSVETREELLQFLDENKPHLSEDECYMITLVASPSNLPLFRSEAEAQEYEDVEIIFTDEPNPEETVDDSSLGFAEFKEQVDQRRERLLADVIEFLKDQ